MPKLLILVFIALNFPCQGQSYYGCDSIFYRAFSNFVKYDDSVGYSLTYGIDADHQNCLSDTVGLINFLLSERFTNQNRNAWKNNKNIALANIEMSYLAHRTAFKKIQPSSDSSYKNVSIIWVQMKGSGSQIIRQTPVEVLKLYFISALYYNTFQFRHEIALTKGARVVETYTDHNIDIVYPPGTTFIVKTRNSNIIKAAYKSYRQWSKKLSNDSLSKLRNKGIDPLFAVKKIQWRNEKHFPFVGRNY